MTSPDAAPRPFWSIRTTRQQGAAALVALAVSLTVGCQLGLVGPDYCGPPPAPIAPAWSQCTPPCPPEETQALAQWWHCFEDPALNGIVCELLGQNLTLREAGERIVEARARLAVTRGERYPQTQTFNGSYSKSRISATTANFFTFPSVFEPDLNIENWSLSFGANWELDFWGRYRRAIQAADASLAAQCAAFDEARVLLIAEAASTYVEMRSYERRAQIARDNAEVQERTWQLVKDKHEEGLIAGLDVDQAESNFRSTQALIPVLETGRRQASHRLCVLMGRPPADLACELGRTAAIPTPPACVAVGIPADVLRQRPDVRRAERELAAQSARIGVAEAEFYPHIGLNGNIGYASANLSQLVQPTSSVGVISPYFSWNILNYCRIKNNVRAEKAVFRQRAYHYQSAVLQAVREAEDAQVELLNNYQRAASLHAAVAAADSAVDKSEHAYRDGATDFGRVYILQTAALQQQERLAIAEQDIALATVALFKALGGGWQACTSCQGAGACFAANDPDSPIAESVAAASPVDATETEATLPPAVTPAPTFAPEPSQQAQSLFGPPAVDLEHVRDAESAPDSLWDGDSDQQVVTGYDAGASSGFPTPSTTTLHPHELWPTPPAPPVQADPVQPPTRAATAVRESPLFNGPKL